MTIRSALNIENLQALVQTGDQQDLLMLLDVNRDGVLAKDLLGSEGLSRAFAALRDRGLVQMAWPQSTGEQTVKLTSSGITLLDNTTISAWSGGTISAEDAHLLLSRGVDIPFAHVDDGRGWGDDETSLFDLQNAQENAWGDAHRVRHEWTLDVLNRIA